MERDLSIIDKSWTLFLDRDGTINKLLEDDYVKSWDEFYFLPGVLDALTIFNKIFGKVIVVTNQQGIGKEIMDHEDLALIHSKMIYEINEQGAYLDEIYYCPELSVFNPVCRKPNPGMALQAKEDFPEIDFRKSVMIGDQATDIKFGNQLDMLTIKIGKQDPIDKADYIFDGLESFYIELLKE